MLFLLVREILCFVGGSVKEPPIHRIE